MSSKGIFLNRNRPLFLCEYLLAEKDKDGLKAKNSTPIGIESRHGQSRHGTSLEEYSQYLHRPSPVDNERDTFLGTFGNLNPGRKPWSAKSKSSQTTSSTVFSEQHSERAPTALLGKATSCFVQSIFHFCIK